MKLDFRKTSLEGVIHIIPEKFEDNRGWLCESYNKNVFLENGIIDEFIQEKHSFSRKNVLRGLHYQKTPFQQSKLVRCSHGSIYDVVVDIRPDSPTFGKYEAFTLTSENSELVYIPHGIAHGFLTLSDQAYFSYMISGEFNKEHDAGIYYNDPVVSVDWLIDNYENIILSEKDKHLPFLQEVTGLLN